ncbi:MAG TPA: hypothetical protein DCW88_00670 [Agrobacterium sp.]|uniref:Uncharacterized protein n=1 Tax=Agrobacterium fabrum TaxID=1176649 RepID=A0A2W5F7H3_9HYPH|nr:MAG: hypothetical protein DI595_10395 [Agrobacterium fabrum]HAU74079.1 hypothetical protein [Agrobacterium sp.]
MLQKLVNKRRFSMVNVRDDRDVAKCHCSKSLRLGAILMRNANLVWRAHNLFFANAKGGLMS